MTPKLKEYTKFLADKNNFPELEPIKPSILAMAILETGWGESDLFNEHNNAHGQKYRDFLSDFCEPISYKAHDGREVYCKFDSYENEIKAMIKRLDTYDGYRNWRLSLHENCINPNYTFMAAIGETWAPKQDYPNKVYGLCEKAKDALKVFNHKQAGATKGQPIKAPLILSVSKGTLNISINREALKGLLKTWDDKHALEKQKVDVVVDGGNLGLPLKGKRIGIDMGHGYNDKTHLFDNGASNSNTGVTERNCIEHCGKLLATELEELGAGVLLLTNDNTQTRMSLTDRYRAFEEFGADAAVSLHFNSYHDSDVQGTETLWREEISKDLAQCLQDGMVNKIGMIDREIKHRPRLTVIASKKIPTALTEGFFVSNNGITRDNYKQQSSLVARGICDGFVEYFKK